MFDVRRARGLQAVARHGTVHEAAATLHLTSSALSQQLAKLEREVGQPLLVRRGRGVELTDAGWLLVRHTEAILAQMERAETELEAHRGRVTGRMMIAAFATATRAILPAALQDLRDRHRDLSVQSHEHEPATAVALLARGDIDIAVIDEWFESEPALGEGVRSLHLLDDVADLAVPVGHQLTGWEGAIDLAACTRERWITWGAGQFGHDWLRRQLHAQGVDPVISHTAGEHQTLLALVAAGLGIALMPRLGRGPLPGSVALLRLGPTPTRRVFALWRTDTSERPAVRAALQALRRGAASATRAADHVLQAPGSAQGTEEGGPATLRASPSDGHERLGREVT